MPNPPVKARGPYTHAMQTATGIHIRSAVSTDARTIVEFNAACARESEGLALDPERVRAGTEAALADPSRGRYFIALDEQGPVGQIMITREWSDWRNAWVWWLQSVYVNERARRRGMFTALLRHVEEEARAEGVAAIRLYVDAGNRRARNAYLSCGFGPGHYRMLEKVLANDA